MINNNTFTAGKYGGTFGKDTEKQENRVKRNIPPLTIKIKEDESENSSEIYGKKYTEKRGV
jgi:hypothetical protein